MNKKILSGGVFVLAMVFGLSHQSLAALNPGCTATSKFSATTGQLCSAPVLITTEGTQPGQSASTQDQSIANAVKTIISGLQAKGQPVPATLKLVAKDYKGVFTKTLTVGTTDPEVKLMQQFLNLHGFTIAKAGPGSPDNESTYFGNATKAALIKFQASVGISPASGLWGPTTRATVAAMSQ